MYVDKTYTLYTRDTSSRLNKKSFVGSSLWITGWCCHKMAKGGKLEPLEMARFGAFIVTIFLLGCLITIF